MKKGNSKLGRPKLGEEKRRFRITASFTLIEKILIFEKAELANISPSDFLYRASLGKQISPPPPIVNLAVIKEINAIYQNLNLLKLNSQYFDSQKIEKYFAILSDLKSEIIEGK